MGICYDYGNEYMTETIYGMIIYDAWEFWVFMRGHLIIPPSNSRQIEAHLGVN